MENRELKALINTLYDYQDLRIRTSNRLSKNKDGEHQNKEDAVLHDGSINTIHGVMLSSRTLEKDIEKQIKKEVHKYRIWDEFFKDVKGCGEGMAGVIISQVDIHKASTRSRLNQYAGLNPGLVRGKKVVKNSDGTTSIITTDEMIKGDKLTAGFVAPYNSFLRAKLLGVLASEFIKLGSPYRKFYDDMKYRLEHSEKLIESGKDTGKMWKDVTPKHRDNAAKRYMIKMFLSDLYEKWRTIEGLEVRVPYAEEYLGIKHHTA